MSKMKITNIELRWSLHDPTRHWVYADLINSDGSLAISATIEYILRVAHERGYEVENIGKFNNKSRPIIIEAKEKG